MEIVWVAKQEHNREEEMSLRKIAKELGISPAYLSDMVNEKRPWRQDLYDRYREVVNTSVNSSHAGWGPQKTLITDTITPMVGGSGLEPLTSAMSTQYSNHLS